MKMKRLTLILVVVLSMVSIGRAEDPPYATTSIISFEMTVNGQPASLDRPFEGAGSYTIPDTIPFEAAITITCQIQPTAAISGSGEIYNRAYAYSSLQMPFEPLVANQWEDISQGEDLASIPIPGTDPIMELTLTTNAPADLYGIELTYTDVQVANSEAYAQQSSTGNTPWTNLAQIQKLVKLTFTVGYAPTDTTPPEITCPGDTTIEAMEPEGVPIDDDRIQAFLDGASATDNSDPPEDIVITNDAPPLFPPGDTTVTFTATDTSGNSSTCQSTVTVVEAAEASLRLIPRIINREGRLQNILTVVRFPEGTAEEDIDIEQPILLFPGDSLDGVEATSQRIVSWTRNGTLRVSIFATFSKDEVTAEVPEDGQVEMMTIGRFTSGQYFYGFDTARIISWSW
jgi:hypothetical protein